MSCNGCRVLRKGCSDDCMLRQCLQWIDSPQAQANATVFVAKFFGRAALMSFIASVPPHQRSSLFQSLLFEAAGRTVNPVSGAVGLLWNGGWHECQTAVMTVLRGGRIEASPRFYAGVSGPPEFDNNVSEYESFRPSRDHMGWGPHATLKRKRSDSRDVGSCGPSGLEIGLMHRMEKIERAATPSEESGTTTLVSGNNRNACEGEIKLLRLFT